MGSHGVGILLLSAAAGYWVLTLAAGQKERLRKVGNLIGLIIIVVSLLGAACKVYYQVTGCPPGKVCAMGWKGKAGAACPMTGKAMGSSAATQ
ncbi:MAG: hypothetical protein HYZ94_03505 [Candidatus Omnitrophica bacterium]|nr:hypothetical protein [Candidatus Omnitrophota bacterium]